MTSARFHSWQDFIMKKRGIVFNGFFLLYIVLIQPLILPALYGAINFEETYIVIGVLMLIAIVVETIGIYWKSKVIGSRKSPEAEFGWLFMLVWMFHAVVSIIVYMWALETFGVEITGDGQPHWSIYGCIFIVIKELAILFILILSDTSKKKSMSTAKELVADFFLLFFACIAYTSTWEAVTNQPGMKLSEYGAGEAALYAGVAGLIFLIFFIPIRMVHVIEDLYSMKTGRDVIEWAISILVVTVAAVAALF